MADVSMNEVVDVENGRTERFTYVKYGYIYLVSGLTPRATAKHVVCESEVAEMWS